MGKSTESPKAIFENAFEISSPAERKAYLDETCADEPELRQKVEALLRAHEEAGSFLENPALAPGSTAAYVEPRQQAGAGPETIDDRGIAAAVRAADAPGTHIGPYKLIEKLGEGGMGAVYLAEQERPIRRQVALKIIKPGLGSAQIVARFEAERQALTMMDHVNIARVFDAGTIPGVRGQESGVRGQGSGVGKQGTDEGPLTPDPGLLTPDSCLLTPDSCLLTPGAARPYFVMELVKGVPMSRFCNDNALTIRERLVLFEQVCQAIQHAHQKGIIHRDIKPSNVLVAMQDGKPLPKVIDFGLAKATEQPLTEHSLFTQIGTIVGTLEYMSPEQADFGAQGIDTRADIYSLGVLLYELLTGTTPLDRTQMRDAGLTEVLRRIKEEEPPRPSARLSGLGERLTAVAAERKTEPSRLPKLLRKELDWISLRALEKDRNRRYETAGSFAGDVRRYLADEPVEACPPSVRYRVGKFVRKHRMLLGVCATVVAVLLVGIVGLIMANAKVSRSLERERDASNRTFATLRTTTDNALTLLVGRRHQLGPREKNFLRELRRNYEGLAADLVRPEQARFIDADGKFRVANISAALGDHGEAAKGYEGAIRLCEQLAADFPANPIHWDLLARARLMSGALLRQTGESERAERSYGQAIAVLDKLVAEFPDGRLYRENLARARSNLGFLQYEQRRLLEAEKSLGAAITLQKQLAAEQPDAPEYRDYLAESHNSLGLVLSENPKRRAEAANAYGEALKLLDGLAAGTPEVPEYRNALAATWNNLGKLYSDYPDGRAEAEKAYLKTMALRKRLAAEFPAIPEYRLELAKSQFNLGTLLMGSGRFADAATALREAIALQKLATGLPATPHYRNDLAGALNNLGAMLRDQGKLEEAAKNYREAIDLQKKLADDFPKASEYRIGLAGSYGNLGNAVRDQGNAAASLAWYDKAIALLEAIPAQERSTGNGKLFLRNAHWDRANALGQLKKHDEAVKDWQQAMDLDEGADRDHLRAFRDAAKMELTLKTYSQPPAAALYEAARVYARATAAAKATNEDGLHKQHTRRTLELLKDARTAGHFRDAQRLRQFQAERDFDALRQDTGFRAFVKEQAQR
jgi:serine/threonine protein kinase/tetratricopeptide (TPR) repeat protein